jgi:alpha-L-fucosidase 2
MRVLWLLLFLPVMLALQAAAQPEPRHGLAFQRLASSWDEGLPFGNGLIGAIAWQKEGRLRLSLDRSDLWDLRPIDGIDRPEFKFSWVVDQVKKGEYEPVQRLFDHPYDRDVAPTKIPAAALEFPLEGLGQAISARLSLDSAVGIITWESGARCLLFVHARLPVGWFRFENLPGDLLPDLIPPAYTVPRKDSLSENPTVDGQDLRRLGYGAPILSRSPGMIRYRQCGYGGFRYDVAVAWRRGPDRTLSGAWSISAFPPYQRPSPPAGDECMRALGRGFPKDFASHRAWWTAFWGKSGIAIPDPGLERQWYLDTYKFGASSRRGAPPITLQGVWTADNGKLPPWRGDFHNDLNTQLSYWPCYSGNRLEQGLAFLDWLWRCKAVAKRYTAAYFGTSGLNFPGVATLAGEPIAGWIQYSLSPTVSAWLAHHFYLHWRYSMDRAFLKERAYPWLRECAEHVEQLSVTGPGGRRKLPLSSSPEINDNSIDAWFSETTNYDLALIRWLYGATAELAAELGLQEEASAWRARLSQWPELALSPVDGRLLVAPGIPLRESHRHFSHLMAIHPLGIVDWKSGERARQTIEASLRDLDRLGTDYWVGYSFSWLGSLFARARQGERAAQALRTFADCFVLKNSFHANGDQSGTGKSKLTYRPFTLEGNFAFAQGIQEMLLQSQGGQVVLFPAVPQHWKDARFTSLRTEGAFLVSAVLREGRVMEVAVEAGADGVFRLANPFGGMAWRAFGKPPHAVIQTGGLLEISCRRGDRFRLAGSPPDGPAR